MAGCKDALTAALAYQVEDFKNREQDAGEAGDHHEKGEDLFLSGPGDEAVHGVGTGVFLALDEQGEVIALIEVVQQIDKSGVHTYFEEQSQDVGPPQASALLASVLVEIATVLAILETVFPFPVFPVCHVHHHQKRGAGDEDELQGPQPDVRDGEEVVKADIVAPRLSRVATEVFLFVAPNLLRCHHKHHDPKEENNRKPDSAKGCGKSVHSTEETLEESPVHDEVCSARLLFLLMNHRGSRFKPNWQKHTIYEPGTK